MNPLQRLNNIPSTYTTKVDYWGNEATESAEEARTERLQIVTMGIVACVACVMMLGVVFVIENRDPRVEIANIELQKARLMIEYEKIRKYESEFLDSQKSKNPYYNFNVFK